MLDILPIEREEAATADRIIGLLKAKGLPIAKTKLGPVPTGLQGVQ
jgi:hypothetical protein